MSKAPKVLPTEQPPYDPGAIHTCTDVFYKFISEYDNILGLFFFITTMAARVDQMQAIATHALSDEEERKKPVETRLIKKLPSVRSESILACWPAIS